MKELKWLFPSKLISQKMSDEFAIGFAEWIFNQNPISLTKKSGLDNSYMRKSTKELLEIYKQEKGL